MIPKEAFIAITAVMVLSCAFGYVLRGIVDKGRKADSEWFLDGLSADHDRWENDPEPTDPEPTKLYNTCDTCNWFMMDVPCLHCNDYDRWEKKK